jgi:hypothetical protein
VIGPSQDLYLNTGQHEHRINTHIKYHSVRASEDSSCPRQLCYHDRPIFIFLFYLYGYSHPTYSTDRYPYSYVFRVLFKDIIYQKKSARDRRNETRNFFRFDQRQLINYCRSCTKLQTSALNGHERRWLTYSKCVSVIVSVLRPCTQGCQIELHLLLESGASFSKHPLFTYPLTILVNDRSSKFIYSSVFFLSYFVHVLIVVIILAAGRMSHSGMY